MKTRMIFVALALVLALPGTAAAASPQKAAGSHTSERIALGTDPNGGEVYAVLDAVVLDGTLLTASIREASDWAALANAPLNRVLARASVAAASAPATGVSYKTIGRRYSAYNVLGQLVIQYTIWQEFGYNGAQIVYTPAPVYDAVANFGWRLERHQESSWWIVPGTHRATRGSYAFRQVVWSPFGDITASELHGWVQVNYRANGSWSGSNGG